MASGIQPKEVLTRSKTYLINYREEIDGCKLPSGKEVFGHFLYRHIILKEDVRVSAHNTILRTEEFWLRSHIPIKAHQHYNEVREIIF